MPDYMVWPPRVIASTEGEVTVERPQAGAPEATVAPAEAPRPPARPPALPGATVSVMAATPTPRDWLERPEALLGSVLGSRYRITALLGRGPMGIACEGESSRGRQVTLKLLPRAPELPVERFAWQVRQALALAHFDHPNVSPLSDFGPLEDGGAFVSRARTPGVTLRSIVRQGGLPIGRALDITRQLASALAAGHAQDIAHGRLKPENIIVQGGSGPGDVIKVVDYGMATLPVDWRAVAPNEDDARRLALRTGIYLPPGARGASPPIDVYSLGVLLFEMIAGQPPFVLEAMSPEGPQGPPLSFAQRNPALVVPASVNELVTALLHPRAEEHGLNAGRAVQMLEALLRRPSAAPAEPVTAQLPSAPPPRKSAPMPPSGPPAAPPAAAAAASPSGLPLVQGGLPLVQAGPPAAWNTPPPSGTVPPPDIQAFTTSSNPPLAWPSAPAPPPSSANSYPPLPQGFSSSMFPPPAIAAPPTPSPPAVAPGTQHPSGRPSVQMDRPFATPSFPPAPVDPDPELRPSFIGRIKRLFSRKRQNEF